MEIAARRAPTEVGNAAATEADLGARLRSGLDLDLLLALDGRDGDPRPECRLDDRDVRIVGELGPLASEGRMCRDMDRDVQAARAPPTWPDLALVRQPDLVAFVDTRRDRHPE